ncbi:UNVERIFIED_ORG: hypothetical protein M2402_002740 [Rahnella aquatilis]|jgi:hypothetical protein
MGSNENRGEERQINHTNVTEYSYYRDFVNNLTLSLRALKIV